MKMTAELVRQLLAYDPDTGVLTWRVHRGRATAGSIAGSKDEKGYIRVDIDGVRYRAHRVIWLYMAGEWPPRGIDHRDTDPSNNKWDNLRLATKAQNAANYMRKSGSRGVSFKRTTQKWVAYIKQAGKITHLGSFANKLDAMICYNYRAVYAFGQYAFLNPIHGYGHD